MATGTPLQRLASHLLGEPVAGWLRARRPDKPWRQIAYELRETTNGEIDVPEQTIINWATEAEPADSGQVSA